MYVSLSLYIYIYITCYYMCISKFGGCKRQDSLSSAQPRIIGRPGVVGDAADSLWGDQASTELRPLNDYYY